MFQRSRILDVMVRAPFRERLGLLEAGEVPMRVWPTDIDTNLHLTNSRYLAMMDVGRFDLILRNGLVGVAVRRRWRPVVGSTAIRFKRDLRPMMRFVLRTRILGWDDKWFFVEQRFVVDGRARAVALVKFLFRDAGDNVAPQRVVDDLDEAVGAPPEIDPDMARWIEEQRF